MKKIVLTDEIIQSLNFLIDGAMKFYGFPAMASHQDKVAKAIVEDVVEVKAEKAE